MLNLLYTLSLLGLDWIREQLYCFTVISKNFQLWFSPKREYSRTFLVQNKLPKKLYRPIKILNFLFRYNYLCTISKDKFTNSFNHHTIWDTLSPIMPLIIFHENLDYIWKRNLQNCFKHAFIKRIVSFLWTGLILFSDVHRGNIYDKFWLKMTINRHLGPKRLFLLKFKSVYQQY